MYKTFKFLFITIFLALISVSIYLFIKEKNKTKNTNTKLEISQRKEIEKSLNLGIAEYDTINPLISTNKNVKEISKLIFEPLFCLTDDYKLETCIAEECSKIDSNIYIISLKQNLKWHDGVNITTKDVEFTINNLKKTSNSIYNANVIDIKTIEIIDNHLIKLTTKCEIDFFEYNLIFPIFSSQYSFNENIIGSGIFKISSINNNKIKLEKNEFHKDFNKIIIKEISINLFNNLGEMYNAFKLGNIDIINTENIDFQDYVGTIGYNSKKYDGRRFSFIALNNEKAELSFKEVRQALNYALDKSEIVKVIYDKSEVNEVPLPKEHWLHCNLISECNSKKATEILLKNGWKFFNNIWSKEINDKKLKLEFSVVVATNKVKNIKTVELIKNQLEQIGVKINIIELNQVQYENILEQRLYDLAFIELNMGISPNLNSFIGYNNFFNYKNQELLYIQNELKAIADEQIIKQRYDNICTIQGKEIPFIGIGFNSNTLIYSSKLMGIFCPNNYNLFYNIEMWYKEKL